MGAESLLINAAYKLGASRVPGDTADIFNKQFEGLVEANRAQAGAGVQALKAGVVGASLVGNKIATIAGADADAARVRHANLAAGMYAQETAATGETAAEKRAADLQAKKDYVNFKRKSKKAAESDKHKVYDPDSPTGTGDWKTVDQVEMEQFGELTPKVEEKEEEYKIGDYGGLNLGGGSSGGLSTNKSAFNKRTPAKKTSPVKNVEEQPAGINVNKLRKSSKPKKATTPSKAKATGQSLSVGETNDIMEKMVTDLAIDGIKSAGQHYNEGGAMNDAHFEAADLAFRNIKNQMYGLINKKNMTLEDKKQNNYLQKETEKLKNSVVKMKALVIQTSQAYNEGHVNTDLSFLGKPNEQMLLKQVMDPNAKLEKLGIIARWQDGELYYEYGPSQMAMEYASNKGIEIDPEQIMLDERKTIPASKLFGMAVMKDIKSENDINGVINKAGQDALEKIGNTGKLLNNNFSKIEGKIEKNFRDIFESSSVNFQDLATRDLTIGGSKRNYKKDLQLNPEINALTYSSLGLTASVDLNNDGIISSDELAPQDRGIIIETLTNPRTSDQKEAAIVELVKYCKALAQQEFNYMRKASGEDGGSQKSILAQNLIAKYNKA